MPIYEYVCQDCGEKYEKLVRSSSTKVELVCPKCGSTRGEKAISLFGTRTSGSQSSIGSANPAPACGPVG
jgi:putative FmdB family regulatory protein